MSRQVCSPKKGGPYSSEQKAKRRDIVARYYFEYGYSARKISQIMKVNRNTINRDINYLCARMNEKNIGYHPEVSVANYLEKMAYNGTRLREMLDEAKTISEKVAIEKLILAVDSKMVDVSLKTTYSQLNLREQVHNEANRLLKESKMKVQFVSDWSYILCSDNAKDKIVEIIKKDRKIR